jgi:hypothetical protein
VLQTLSEQNLIKNQTSSAKSGPYSFAEASDTRVETAKVDALWIICFVKEN